MRLSIVASILTLALTQTSAQAYLRNGTDVYFLTSDHSLFPSLCLYELKNAPAPSSIKHIFNISKNPHGNLIYASQAHANENYLSIAKKVRGGVLGTPTQYEEVAKLFHSGDPLQYEAFQKLDQAGEPFTLREVEILAQTLIPKEEPIDFSEAKPVVPNRMGVYAYKGRVEGLNFHLADQPENKALIDAYDLLVKDYKTSKQYVSSIRAIARIEKEAETVKSLRMPGPLSWFDTTDKELDRLANERKTQEAIQSLARGNAKIPRGEISSAAIEDMKKVFEKFSERNAGQCPVSPEL